MTNKKNKTTIEGLERRSFKNEIRVENDDSRKVVGYASVFNSLSENLGGYREKIDSNAFNSVLENNPDTRALFNHDANQILARTLSGTLSLSVDDKGLRYSFEVPEGLSYGDDLLVNLKNGNITQSSFGFVVEDDSWGQDEDGNTIRTINKISRLLDISPVTYPAYPDSSVSQVRFLEYRTELEKKENEKQDKDLIKRNLYKRELELLKIKKSK
jgi:HK97 family phage prohead protease